MKIKLFRRRNAERERMEEYYAEIQAMYNNMRIWRHDFRHHLQVLRAYSASGEWQALDQYLSEIDRSFALLEPGVRTGNSAVDAILTSKFSLAREKGIEIKATANVSRALSLPAMDMVVILGNLLDNAIEATLPLPDVERLIRVYLETKGNYLYVCITNRTDELKLTASDGIFSTIHGAGRGLGLPKVRSLVHELGGNFRCASEDNAFACELFLPA